MRYHFIGWKSTLSHTTQTFFRHTLDLPTSRAQSFSRARSASGRFFMFLRQNERESGKTTGTGNEKRRTLRKSRHTQILLQTFLFGSEDLTLHAISTVYTIYKCLLTPSYSMAIRALSCALRAAGKNNFLD